jgi:hypothetical protein
MNRFYPDDSTVAILGGCELIDDSSSNEMLPEGDDNGDGDGMGDGNGWGNGGCIYYDPRQDCLAGNGDGWGIGEGTVDHHDRGIGRGIEGKENGDGDGIGW